MTDTGEPLRSLRQFFTTAFAADEIRRLLGDLPCGASILTLLPGETACCEELVDKAVQILNHRGEVDAHLFASMSLRRPARLFEIMKIAGLNGIEPKQIDAIKSVLRAPTYSADVGPGPSGGGQEMGSDRLDVLYYPFSRSIDPSSVKQMLLVFDGLHFLDPVDDARWRAMLMRFNEKAHDPEFRRYRIIDEALPVLIQEGAVVRVAPSSLGERHHDAITRGTLNDLNDPTWVETASAPNRYQMPYQRHTDCGKPVWEIFRDKLPEALIDAFSTDSRMHGHLVVKGGPDESSIVSYAAGSAATLNFHLSAAGQLGLSPITDSRLHHKLLRMKLDRTARQPNEDVRAAPSVNDQFTTRLAMNLLDDVLPREALASVRFDEILEFRARTRILRKHFTLDLRLALKDHLTAHEGCLGPRVDDLYLKLGRSVREYRAELEAVRCTVWPAWINPMSATFSLGGAGAIAMTYVGILENLFLVGSAVAGVSFAKGMIESRANQRRLRAQARPTVSYLSCVKEKFGTQNQ